MKGYRYMKKFLMTLTLITAILSVNIYARDVSVSLAVNEETIIVNGERYEIPKLLIIMDKTYVPLYSVAPLLGLPSNWIATDEGWATVTNNETILTYTPIYYWDNLNEYKYFVKDGQVYVPLRHLTDLSGLSLTYENGIITIGEPDENTYFSEVSQSESDNWLYSAYPYEAYHTVYPYEVYSYEKMLEDATELSKLYPDTIKLSSIGKSVEGRDLLLIKFGRGDKKIFVCGTHHAREYISTTYLMNAIDKYSYADKYDLFWNEYNVSDILDKVTFHIVPMVNPDGVNLVQNGIYATTNAGELSKMKIYEGAKYGYSAWKANIRGVDLNWNYDKDWNIKKNKNPNGSTGFNGNGPYTEPETIAVSDYVDSIMFDAYFSFHTQGEIFYWAEDTVNPLGLHNKIQKDTGFTPVYDDGLGEIGGSFFDYVYRKYKKPTITIELCPYIGNYPYPNSDFDTVWKPAQNILLIGGETVGE